MSSGVALNFCGGGGDREEVEILRDSAMVSQQQDQDIDINIGSKDQLQQFLPPDFNIDDLLGSDGDREEEKNEELIALMESILENLKMESAHVEENTHFGKVNYEDIAQEEYFRAPTKAPPRESHGDYAEQQGKAVNERHKDTDVEELESALKQLN